MATLTIKSDHQPLGGPARQGYTLEAKGSTWSATVHTFVSGEDRACLRWYFEDYAERDPFQTSEAANAEDILQCYGTQLADALELWRCPPSYLNARLRLNVEIVRQLDKSSQPALWEILENLALWPAKCRPCAVTVTRCVAPGTQGQVLPRPQVWLPSICGQINVLIVYARPQGARDIPHRLVSRAVLEAAAQSRRLIHVDIVRPGTFDAFREHLQGRPVGCYQLVHFDVHGVEQDGKIWLQFLKRREQEYGPDPIAISDVATELVGAGVRYVVMNACRSAYADRGNLSLAAALIYYGLEAVVAMSYKIASSAVETFVKAFYRNLFNGSATFEDSASVARAALATKPMKRTKFGERVAVADSIVPVCLLSDPGETQPFYADLINDDVEFKHLNFLEDDDEYPIGRENDILLLENSLLLESNIGLLVGRIGAGKTKLLNYAASWWEATNFVQRTIWANLGHMKAGYDLQHLPDFIESLVFGQEVVFDRTIIEYLRTNRCLIVLDGIESYAWPEESSLGQQQKHLKAFLRALFGGKTMVMLSSRKSEPWLDRLGPQKSKEVPRPIAFTRPLEGLATLQGVQLATQLIKERRSEFQLDKEDTSFAEQLVKLVEGNPLALEILSIDFCQKSLSFEDYYYALLEGGEIQVDERWLKQNDEGARGAVELSNFIFESNNPSEKERQAMFETTFAAILGGKPVPLQGLIHAISPSFLGMIWRAMASDDLIYYASILNLATASSLNRHGLNSHFSATPNREDIANDSLAYMFYSGIRTHFDDIISRDQNLQHLKVLLETLVNKLLTMGYLEHPATNMRNLPQKAYLRVHPLLPIMARTSSDFAANTSTIVDAFFRYQTSCLSDWPHDYMYWNKVWDQPKLEMSLNFINFYAAVRIALQQHTEAEWSSETALIMLITCISKGTFSDPSRHNLLEPLWKVVVSRSLKMYDCLTSDEPDSISISMPTFLVPQDLSGDLKLLHCRSILQVILAAELGLGGLGMVNIGHLKEGDPLFHRIVSVLERELIDRKSGSANAVLGGMLEAWKSFPQMFRAAASQRFDEGAAWEVREHFMRDQIQRRGVEEYPAEQKGWHAIPHAQNSLSVSYELLIDLPAKIKSMVSEGLYAKARLLLQSKLNEEINYRGNQARNLATIFELLYWLSKKEEKWLDAISHLNRAKALRESTGQMDAMQQASWEGKLAKLYEKNGDFDTVLAYVKLLIGKANAAHATNPAVEIACLRRVWKLEYSKRLDGIVSDIFLVVRAALTLHRTKCTYGRIQRGQWPLQPLTITNGSKPNWMFGAINPRPQTIAIAFLLMMFGNLINMSHILKCKMFIDGPNEDFKKAVEAGLELEQRLFCPADTPLGCKHFSAKETFEPQRRLFEHLYSCGERYLRGEYVETDEDGSLVFPEAPFAPSTIWGNTATGGLLGDTVLTAGTYRCPTRIMLRMAGYLTDDWPE